MIYRGSNPALLALFILFLLFKLNCFNNFSAKRAGEGVGKPSPNRALSGRS
jgi:hypothetical protein